MPFCGVRAASASVGKLGRGGRVTLTGAGEEDGHGHIIPGWGVAPGSPGEWEALTINQIEPGDSCCRALLLGTFSRFASLASGPGHGSGQVR